MKLKRHIILCMLEIKFSFNDLLAKLCDKELSSVVMRNVSYAGLIKREILNFR